MSSSHNMMSTLGLQPGWPGGPHLWIPKEFTSLTGSVSLYLVAMGDAASHNNKVTGFHRVPAAFRAGPGRPCMAFLGF